MYTTLYFATSLIISSTNTTKQKSSVIATKKKKLKEAKTIFKSLQKEKLVELMSYARARATELHVIEHLS